MFEFFTALVALALGYLIPGFLLSFLVFKHNELSTAERFALSIAFSVALIGMLMTLLGLTIGFSATSTLLILALICACAYLGAKDELHTFFRHRTYSSELPRFTLLEGIAFFVIAFQIVMAFYFSAFFPIDGGDAITFHAPLAKLYAEQGRLVQPDGVLSLYTPLPHGFHLFASWFYLLNGFNDLYLRLCPPILFLASCLLVYSFGRRLFDSTLATIATPIFASTPLLIAHAQVAYINLPEMFFALAGTFVLMLALKQGKNANPAYFVAAGFLGGFAALVKPTGMLSFGLLAVLLAFYFRRMGFIRPVALLALGAILSGSIIWFAVNADYFLNPSSHFYLLNPYAPHIFPTYTTFFFLDNQVAVNQGIGPFFISFGLVGLALIYGLREKKWEHKFALAWLALSFLIAELFLLKLGARFMLTSIAATSLFAAYGFDRLSISRRTTIAFLAVLLLALEILPSFAIGGIGFKTARISYETNSFEIIPSYPPPSHDAFLRFAYGPIMDGVVYLNQNTSASSSILVNLPLTYFINRTIYQTIDLPEPMAFVDELRYLEKRNIDYIFLTTTDTDSSCLCCPCTAVEANIDDENIFTLAYENPRVSIYKINYSVHSDTDGA